MFKSHKDTTYCHLLASIKLCLMELGAKSKQNETDPLMNHKEA